MRRSKVLLLVILILLGGSLYARPYLGLSQSLISTGLEVGMLSRTFEQNIALSLPLAAPSFENPDIQTTILYRLGCFSPVMVGLGLKANIGWQQAVGYELGLGFSLSLSYEFLFSRGVLFVEGTYLPWITEQGAPVDPIVSQMVRQYVRFGYRHVL